MLYCFTAYNRVCFWCGVISEPMTSEQKLHRVRNSFVSVSSFKM